MGECQASNHVLQGEEDLISAAQNIVKALETNKILTDEARKILADLGSQLSSIARESDSKGEEESSPCEIEELINTVQDKVMKWEVEQSMIWDYGPEAGYEYLKAVDDARKLTERLESLNASKDSEEDGLLQRAHDILQTGMVRLEEEFRHLLVQNRQPLEPEHMSFRSSEDDTVVDDGSIVSFGDESVDDVVQRDSISRGSEEYIIELVHPDVVPDLRSIASLMFDSNYGHECSQAYVSVRKDALDDCLYILEVEKLSIEDVLKLDWHTLNSKIRRWIRAMKIFVRVYLASEKWLSDQIFGELESVSSACFTESSKSSTLQLLNFAEAIAIGPHQPEKLIRILDMYEVLSDLITDVDALFFGDNVSSVRMEFQDVLRRLGDCAKATFVEFGNAVATNISSTPFPGGGNHHLTRYVMNYLRTLTEYSKTLDVLLKDSNDKDDDLVSASPDRRRSPSSEDEEVTSSSPSPVALHFKSLISILECNIDDKSKLYKDDALRHIFLMNNIHYMAEKVKNTELRAILGDDWIRKHNWQFQQHAMSYERATWSPILSLLKDDGLQNPGSNSISKTLKERLQSFYLAFEEVYKSQTAWSIPDFQLREDLRISTSLKVIQAYRTFVGRHTNHVISDKHIKYSADDLENFLLDLFEGSPRSLHGYHKK